MGLDVVGLVVDVVVGLVVVSILRFRSYDFDLSFRLLESLSVRRDSREPDPWRPSFLYMRASLVLSSFNSA